MMVSPSVVLLAPRVSALPTMVLQQDVSRSVMLLLLISTPGRHYALSTGARAKPDIDPACVLLLPITQAQFPADSGDGGGQLPDAALAVGALADDDVEASLPCLVALWMRASRISFASSANSPWRSMVSGGRSALLARKM